MDTAVIPFWSKRDNGDLGRLIESLPKDLEILVVVDQGSIEPHLKEDQRSRVSLFHMEERGYFTGTVNHGIENAPAGTDILVLNQDVRFLNHTFFKDLKRFKNIYALIGESVADHPAWPRGYVRGIIAWIRRDLLDAIGMLDAKEWPHWGPFCDYQLRAARAGFKILPIPKIPGLAHHKRSIGKSTLEAIQTEPQLKEKLFKTPPTISVILANHNQKAFLLDALHSLIGGPTDLGDHPGQTYKSFEIIIVDDASTDNSQALIKSLEDPFKGIRTLLRPERGGSPVAYNDAIRIAHGKYITILAADDMRDPTALEKMLALARANPHSFVYDDAYLFNKESGKYEQWRLRDYDFETILVKNQIHSAIFYPRQAWIETGGYPEIMIDGREDWAFNVTLGLAGWCGVHLAEPTFWYRRQGQNRSLTNAGDAWRERFAKQMYTLFKPIYDGDRPDMCCGDRTKEPMKKTPYKKTLLPGAEGQVYVRYLGLGLGSVTYVGAVTRASYTVKKGITIPVDPRDLTTKNSRRPGLLELFQGKHYLFELIEAPAVRKVAPTKPQPEPPTPSVGSGGQPEDLTVIKGIGEATAKVLHEAGYLTVKDVAKADPQKLNDQLRAAKLWRVNAMNLIAGAQAL